MKKVDKTILNGKQINKYEQGNANDIRMDAEDEAYAIENPEIEEDGEEEAEDIEKFGKLSQKLNLKSYKVGINDAYGIYRDLKNNGNLKNLRSRIFNLSKQTYQKQAKEQAKKNKILQKEKVHNQKIINKLAKKSLSYTYRKAYLSRAFKNSFYQQGSNLELRDKDLDNSLKMQKPNTKYVRNYVADYIHPYKRDKYNFMKSEHSHHYMPINEFKSYLKHVQTSSEDFDGEEDGVISDISADKMTMLNNLCKSKYIKNARREFGYMNTEPLSKLKKQLNYKKKLNQNSAILNPNQISKKCDKHFNITTNNYHKFVRSYQQKGWHDYGYFNEVMHDDYSKDIKSWNKVSNFAQLSKYSNQPLYLYKGDMEYARVQINQLGNNPSEHSISNVKNRSFIHSKLIYLQNHNPKSFKSFKSKIFTPKEIKKYTSKIRQINHNYRTIKHNMLDYKNGNSTQHLLEMYDNDENAIKNGMPLNAENTDILKKDGKAIDKNVKKWLPLLDKNNQKKIEKARNYTSRHYSRYTTNSVRQVIDDLGNNNNLVKMYNEQILKASNKFYQKGVNRLHSTNKLSRNLTNINKFNHHSMTKNNHKFTISRQKNHKYNVKPKNRNRQKTNNRKYNWEIAKQRNEIER